MMGKQFQRSFLAFFYMTDTTEQSRYSIAYEILTHPNSQQLFLYAHLLKRVAVTLFLKILHIRERLQKID